MQFLFSIWKILHLTEYFYTGTAHGARNNYQVCMATRAPVQHKYKDSRKYLGVFRDKLIPKVSSVHHIITYSEAEAYLCLPGKPTKLKYDDLEFWLTHASDLS